MYQLIMIIHVLAAACIIALVLVQQGKGATAGAGFGSGASQTVFGSRGSGSFLLKVTIGFVLVFFSTSIALNYIASTAVKRQQPLALPVIPGDQLPQGSSSLPVTPSSIPSSTTTAPMQLPVEGEQKK
jgi:preprotein translocase subunit SecG